MFECAAAAARVMRAGRITTSRSRSDQCGELSARPRFLLLDELGLGSIAGCSSMHENRAAIAQPADTRTACGNARDLDQLCHLVPTSLEPARRCCLLF